MFKSIPAAEYRTRREEIIQHVVEPLANQAAEAAANLTRMTILSGARALLDGIYLVTHGELPNETPVFRVQPPAGQEYRA